MLIQDPQSPSIGHWVSDHSRTEREKIYSKMNFKIKLHPMWAKIWLNFYREGLTPQKKPLHQSTSKTNRYKCATNMTVRLKWCDASSQAISLSPLLWVHLWASPSGNQNLLRHQSGTNVNLLVSGMLDSRPRGSPRSTLPKGAPSFSPFSCAAGPPVWHGSQPDAGTSVPLRGVPFPSVASWPPSA